MVVNSLGLLHWWREKNIHGAEKSRQLDETMH